MFHTVIKIQWHLQGSCVLKCLKSEDCQTTILGISGGGSSTCGIYSGTVVGGIFLTTKQTVYVMRKSIQKCSPSFSDFGVYGGCYTLLQDGSWTGTWAQAKAGCDALNPPFTRLAGKRGGVIGAFRGKFYVFPALRSFFPCFLAFCHFSLSFGCFPVFRSFSTVLSVFHSFEKQFSFFRKYFQVFRFSVTQKCHFLVSRTLLFSGFPQNFPPFSGFPPLFCAFLPFRHKYNAPSNK